MARRVGEVVAGRDEGGLGCVPCDGLPGFDLAGVREGGGEDVDSGAAGGSVEEKAGGGGVRGLRGRRGRRWGLRRRGSDDESVLRGEMTLKLAAVRVVRRWVAKVRVMSFSRMWLGELGPGVGASVGGV